MRYRAYWKDTWYECEDYGALCRCLTWCGAESFTCLSPSVLSSSESIVTSLVCDCIIWKEDEN